MNRIASDAIAQQIGVDLTVINPDEFRLGLNYELQFEPDRLSAARAAHTNLQLRSTYYTDLTRMEQRLDSADKAIPNPPSSSLISTLRKRKPKIFTRQK